MSREFSLLSDHEFTVLISRLKTDTRRRRPVDVDRLILDAEEMRLLLRRVRRLMKDQRDVFNDMGIIGHG